MLLWEPIRLSTSRASGFSRKRTRGGSGGQKEFEMERTMTEAELSCRAQAIRGESCIVQSSMEVSFRANYSNDKNDYARCKIVDFKIVRTKKLVKLVFKQ